MTIIGLNPTCPKAARWEAYKQSLTTKGELVNADGKATVQDIVAALCDKLRVKGVGR